jgi:hypothetical protein
MIILIDLRKNIRYSINMRPQTFVPSTLRRFLRHRKIATMADMKDALNTSSDATVFRMLKSVDYCTSYSHRRRYYALEKMVDFDEQGIWCYRSVFFSKSGTLVATAESFVAQSLAGFYADELECILHVNVKDVLPYLARQGRVVRVKISGRYLYCASKASAKKRQISARSRKLSETDVYRSRVDGQVVPEEVKAAIILFFSVLDEQQRRMFAGLEAMKWGFGGDTKIAELLDMDAKTVARGRQQLLNEDVETQQTRKSGGGRKRVEKKRHN